MALGSGFATFSNSLTNPYSTLGDPISFPRHFDQHGDNVSIDSTDLSSDEKAYFNNLCRRPVPLQYRDCHGRLFALVRFIVDELRKVKGLLPRYRMPSLGPGPISDFDGAGHERQPSDAEMKRRKRYRETLKERYPRVRGLRTRVGARLDHTARRLSSSKPAMTRRSTMPTSIGTANVPTSDGEPLSIETPPHEGDTEPSRRASLVDTVTATVKGLKPKRSRRPSSMEERGRQDERDDAEEMDQVGNLPSHVMYRGSSMPFDIPSRASTLRRRFTTGDGATIGNRSRSSSILSTNSSFASTAATMGSSIGARLRQPPGALYPVLESPAALASNTSFCDGPDYMTAEDRSLRTVTPFNTPFASRNASTATLHSVRRAASPSPSAVEAHPWDDKEKVKDTIIWTEHVTPPVQAGSLSGAGTRRRSLDSLRARQHTGKPLSKISEADRESPSPSPRTTYLRIIDSKQAVKPLAKPLARPLKVRSSLPRITSKVSDRTAPSYDQASIQTLPSVSDPSTNTSTKTQWSQASLSVRISKDLTRSKSAPKRAKVDPIQPSQRGLSRQPSFDCGGPTEQEFRDEWPSTKQKASYATTFNLFNAGG